MTARLLVGFVFLLLFAPVARPVQSYPGIGLEVDDPHTLAYVIDDLSPDAIRLGITAERIRGIVETRLRQDRVEPQVEALADHYIAIRIDISGAAFQSSLRFVRSVAYTAKATPYVVLAPTWQRSSAGLHDNDPAKVVASLGPLLDRFLEEFQSTNPQ